MTSGNSFEGSAIAEFLVTHQSVTAPLIDWGMTLALLAIVLSPFLLIRLKRFQPIRWWHIVSAYGVSFFIFFVAVIIIFSVPRNLIIEILPTYELLDAYDYVPLKIGVALLFAYPVLVFYCTKILFKSFTGKNFILSILVAGMFIFILWNISMYVMAVGIGQASQNF